MNREESRKITDCVQCGKRIEGEIWESGKRINTTIGPMHIGCWTPSVNALVTDPIYLAMDLGSYRL
jgi:hypothetical protein